MRSGIPSVFFQLYPLQFFRLEDDYKIAPESSLSKKIIQNKNNFNPTLTLLIHLQN